MMRETDLIHFYDVIMVGGGPAGLTAALYLSRARYRVLVLEKEQFGGQITITSEVVNYPGILRTDGKTLTKTMQKQAQAFGAEFLLAEAVKIEADGDIKRIHTSRGDYYCFGILIASGAHPRKIGFQGEEEFRGRGVAYCATCDGEFFAGKEVFVIGGGFAAAEESVFLTRYARHVTVLIRGDDFSWANTAADAARSHEKITVRTHMEVESVLGDSALKTIRCRNNQTGEIVEYHAEGDDSFGLFVFAGYEPETAVLKGLAELDEQGYVLTDRNQKTSAEGIYAAGDVCVKHLRQVATAVGDGASAAIELERYASLMQKRTGIRPQKPQEKRSLQDAPKDQAGQELFGPDILEQLQTVFSRMEKPLVLSLSLDDRPVSEELKRYMDAMASLTDKLIVRIDDAGREEELPCVHILQKNGSDTGLAFHGVPGGHEFTSFVLGLYNVSGPGQAIDEDLAEKIKRIYKSCDERPVSGDGRRKSHIWKKEYRPAHRMAVGKIIYEKSLRSMSAGIFGSRFAVTDAEAERFSYKG